MWVPEVSRDLKGPGDRQSLTSGSLTLNILIKFQGGVEAIDIKGPNHIVPRQYSFYLRGPTTS